MADIKISQLNELLLVADSDVLVINDVDADETKKITLANLLANIATNILDSDTGVIVPAGNLTVANKITAGGDVDTTGDVAFGTLTDRTEGITIAKIVDGADGILNNLSDSSVPTSLAVANYVDSNGRGSRAVVSIQTATALASGAEEDLDINGFKTFALLSASCNWPSDVFIYTDDASRTADSARTLGSPVNPTVNLVTEFSLDSTTAEVFAPAVVGFNNNNPVGTSIVTRLENTGATHPAINTATLSLTAVKLED